MTLKDETILSGQQQFKGLSHPMIIHFCSIYSHKPSDDQVHVLLNSTYLQLISLLLYRYMYIVLGWQLPHQIPNVIAVYFSNFRLLGLLEFGLLKPKIGKISSALFVVKSLYGKACWNII
jgi:hypothetical protein